MLDWDWKYLRWIGAGLLLGSYGVKLLTSRDMKKVYTKGTAAVFRMKEEVLRDVEVLKENCGDIAADAREINAQRQAELDAREIEDAKAVLAAAEDAAPAGPEA